VGDADRVAPGERGSSVGGSGPVKVRKHPLNDPAVNRADHRVFNHRVTERTVLSDDLQTISALFGVSGEPVSGEGIGYRMKGTAKRPVGFFWFDGGRHRSPVFRTDFFGHAFGYVGGEQSKGPAQKADQNVVLSDINREPDLWFGRSVAFRGSSDPALGFGDRNFEISTRSEFV